MLDKNGKSVEVGDTLLVTLDKVGNTRLVKVLEVCANYCRCVVGDTKCRIRSNDCVAVNPDDYDIRNGHQICVRNLVSH